MVKFGRRWSCAWREVVTDNVKCKEFGNMWERVKREKYDSEYDSDSSEDSELTQGNINMEKVNKIKPKQKQRRYMYVLFL